MQRQLVILSLAVWSRVSESSGQLLQLLGPASALYVPDRQASPLDAATVIACSQQACQPMKCSEAEQISDASVLPPQQLATIPKPDQAL